MTFGHIRLLYLLLIIPVAIVAYAFDGQRRRRALSLIGHLPMLRKMTASSSPGRRRWRAILTVAAVGCLGVALARPQLPGRAKLTESRGLDLVVALDFSRSMLARDVSPTRLDRAKRELEHLIDRLKGDRIGLVAFAGETMSYPLTNDYEAAKLFWRELVPSDMPVGGSDLGRALRAATELLVRGKKENDKRKGAQVILLLTDGEDTEGQGLQAAREAAALGIRIYTLGIGTGERPFVQVTDETGASNYLAGTDGEPLRVGLDDAGLRQIAAAAEGEYVALDARRFGVERVQSAIASLERTQEEARFEREPEDVGRFFILPAFILLLLEAAVRERRREAKKVAAQAPAQLQKAAVIFVLLFPFVSGFDLFMRRDPNVEEGNKQLAAGKADKALEAYDRASGALPEEPILHFDRGAALYQLGKYPEAQKEFMHATEGHDPGLKADAYYNMGNSLMKQERYKDALDAYKHTLTLRPEDRRAKWNLELALRRLREEQEKKQQQQQQQQQQQDQKDQKKDQQQKDQQQKDQQQKDQQQKDQQQKDQQQKDQQQKDQQQQQQQQQQQDAQQQQQKEQQAAKKEPAKEIDKQDAEAVLDALERVEPTVQKELARRRAGGRRPTKDW
jgi:Ca-activated chloride channel family protein